MAARKLFDHIHKALSAVLETLLGARMFFRARRFEARLTTVDFLVRASLVAAQIANVVAIQEHPA